MPEVVRSAWGDLVALLRKSPSSWTEAAATEFLASALERRANTRVVVLPGQAIGARAAELRMQAHESREAMLMATFRWFPPNLYRAHGYRLKLREDVRRLAALREQVTTVDGAALFVDLMGVVRAEYLADLAVEEPGVPILGYSARYGELAGG